VQVYVPIPSAVDTAEVLTNANLLDVIAACLSLMDEQHIDGEHTILAHHPLYKMWDGHGPALCAYGLAMCDEVRRRGFASEFVTDEVERFSATLSEQLENACSGEYTLAHPGWWGSVSLHHAHQSELLRQNPAHYQRYFPETPIDLPQLWPAA